MNFFPGAAHVFDTGLARSTPDEQIWEYAAAGGFTIVTADSDFLDLANSRGAPPEVVHLEKCDYRTSRVERILRRQAVLIADLEQSSRPTLTIRNTTLPG
jgi:predicted nuclease of predicted toxin-antitoxin system